MVGSQGGRAGRPRAEGDEPGRSAKPLYQELQRHFLAAGDHASIPVGWVEGWFFTDKKLRGFKPAVTVYDNITFMKVWIAP